jgi:tRNA nucleotidyltransferase (CCA-adding enzyme)
MMNLNSPPEFDRILKSVAEEITPTQAEILHIDNIIEKITQFIQSSEIPPEIFITFIEPQGSTGIKQTALKNAADIDLFIGIDPQFLLSQKFSSKKERRQYIRDLFKKLTKKWLIPCLTSNQVDKVHISYAEHPYVSAEFQGIDLDVVICFDISAEYLQKNGPITAVDRTPYHSRFIRNNLSQKQKDEVRLLKYFFKCFHCYGDQSAIGRSGFIGYGAELLIEYYGTLWNLFTHFQELDQKIIISKTLDEATVFRRLGKNFSTITSQFFPNDCLFILDPTDFKRNVGSSTSPRAYRLISDKIQNFIQNPSQDLFKKIPIPKLESLDLDPQERFKLFYAEFHRIEEDHYTKFRDKLYHLMNNIIRAGTIEIGTAPRFDFIQGELLFNPSKGSYVLAFYTNTPQISTTYERKGPKINDEPFYSKFLTKNPTAYERGDYLHVVVEREFISFEDFLKARIPIKKIANLKLNTIGCGNDNTFSSMASQSMANLQVNILPYLPERVEFYEK